MAHFAKINDDSIVENVIVINDEFENDGQNYINNVLGLEGRWIQTSYNNRIRKVFAGIGFTYDEQNDVFILPQPFPSWYLDSNFDWQPPIPKPDGNYWWNEALREWYEPETL